MQTDCPFLEQMRRPQMGGVHGCGAGINFYPVGKDRARCRVCPFASPGSVPDCQHLYANTWLLTHPDRTPFVQAELVCGLTDDLLPDVRHCAHCTERLPQIARFSWPAMVPAMAG